MKKLLLSGVAAVLLTTPAAWAAGSSAEEFSLVVMDPLAAPLSCPCVEGYAQRNYEALGEHLSQALDRPVRVTFAESLAKALAKDHCDHADLIIGKDSVVRSDSQRAGYKLSAVARLTDLEGNATQTGLIVVRSSDAAQRTEDLAGYRILYGPADCEEKFAAARRLLDSAGIQVAAAEQAEISAACSDGACKIIEWGDAEQAAAVISSYAAPLLEGCGTINKGDLRVVGETGPVPFITAFVTDKLSESDHQRVRDALLAVVEHPELLLALESALGFIEPDEEYREKHSPEGARTPPKAAKPVQSTSWPDFLGPSRNGHTAWLPDQLPPSPKITWRQPMLFAGMGGVAADAERVLIGDRDPTNNLDVWRCYAADTGEELWTIAYPAFGRLDYDNLPRATPVMRGGRAYLQGAFGDLVCAELATGRTLWQLNLLDYFDAEHELVWGTCSTPLLADGRLIVNPGAPAASLVALDPETGSVLWQSPGARHAYASPVVANLGGVRQIVAYDRDSLGGWEPATGDRLWTLTPPTPGDFNVPTPVVVGNRLLLVSENNGARLYSFDNAGRIRPEPDAVNKKVRPDMSTPVVASGRLFCVNDKMYCLDATTLKLKWVDDRTTFASYAPLLTDGARLLAVGKGGELVLINTGADRYSIVSRLAVFPDAPANQLYGCPAIVGDRLYLRGETELVCLALGQ